jgi:hypothetical protein
LAFYLLSSGKGNHSILGEVIQFNFWLYELPPAALKALSRGINGIGAYGIPWKRFSDAPNGKVRLVEGVKSYFPGIGCKQHLTGLLVRNCHSLLAFKLVKFLFVIPASIFNVTYNAFQRQFTKGKIASPKAFKMESS